MWEITWKISENCPPDLVRISTSSLTLFLFSPKQLPNDNCQIIFIQEIKTTIKWMSDHYTTCIKVSFPHLTLTFCWWYEKKSSPVMTSENDAFPANLHVHVSHKLIKVSPHRNLTWRLNTPPSVLTKPDRSVYLYRWHFNKATLPRDNLLQKSVIVRTGGACGPI